MGLATEPIRRVSRRHPCPICGKTKWCGVTSTFVICMRVPSDRPTQNGGWVHLLGPERPADLPPPPPRSGEPAAPVERRHRVYRELLGLLALDERHRENLRKRGVEDEAVLAHLEYRSLPLKGRAKLVRALGERLGEEALRGVPGVFWREGERRAYPTLAGPPGMLIPTRDWDGRIVAFQIRLDKPPEDDPELKYLWLSSDGRPGGASSGAPLHWAKPRPGAGARLTEQAEGSPLEGLCRLYGRHPERPLVLVTEGVLKSDLAAEWTGLLTLGIPGVSLAHHAVEALAGDEAPVRPLAVVLAFDADAARKEEVRRARDRLAAALLERGVPVLLAKWPEAAGKGIDDILAAGEGRRIRLEPFGAAAVA